jgi:hypothetical protein
MGLSSLHFGSPAIQFKAQSQKPIFYLELSASSLELLWTGSSAPSALRRSCSYRWILSSLAGNKKAAKVISFLWRPDWHGLIGFSLVALRPRLSPGVP